jgi:hypothetical protein
MLSIYLDSYTEARIVLEPIYYQEQLLFPSFGGLRKGNLKVFKDLLFGSSEFTSFYFYRRPFVDL